MSGPFITDPKVIVGWTFKYGCLLKQRGATRLHLIWDGLKPWSYSSGYAMDIGRSIAGSGDPRAKLPCRTYEREGVDLHKLTEAQIRRELNIPASDAILVCSETLIRQYLVGTEDWLGNQITEEALAAMDAHAERADIELKPTRQFGDIISTNMGGVKAKPVPWLWPDRIPRGMLTIFAGSPGVGKSYVSLYLAGRITTGGIWPDVGKEAPLGTVILLAAEDSKEYTIKQRLDALGADAYRIEKIEMVRPDQIGDERTFDLSQDIKRLEIMVKKTGAKLIIVDPVNSYLGGKQDGFKDTEVRRVLDPLKEMAERLDIAVVLLMHTKKGIEEEILYQIGGSIAFSAVARNVFFCTRDPDTPGRFYFTHAKPLQAESPSLSYTISGETGIVWGTDEIKLSAREILAKQHQKKPGPQQTARKEAKQWLVEYLKDGPQTDGWATAAELGLKEKTVRRALEDLCVKIEPIRAGGKIAGYRWTMPPRPERPPF
jgi:AAA domain-containing protein